MAWPPARLFHSVPRLDGVVPEHPSPGQRDRWAGRNPAIGSHRHPFGMNGGCVWLELHHLLLLSVHKPPLAARLGRIISVAGAFLEHLDNPTETPLRPAVEVAVSRLTTSSGY